MTDSVIPRKGDSIFYCSLIITGAYLTPYKYVEWVICIDHYYPFLVIMFNTHQLMKVHSLIILETFRSYEGPNRDDDIGFVFIY
ncbi:hypothetical protein A0J61_02233 [Choanephora cucurbitarum]|uniref:Uncharacterized protein n=1 Tax=Choanephora cucurbitarum TaxID=101091 RepID=A0A1C7NKY5_9FUNG|nr:hypothetical protein A0J61_02233 [Choanephora cucurbitarum]